MTTADETRQLHAEVAQQLSARISDELLQVIDRYRHLDTEGPVFLRYVTLHAVVELLGHLLTEALDEDHDRAQAWATKTIDQLSLHVSTPASARPQ